VLHQKIEVVLAYYYMKKEDLTVAVEEGRSFVEEPGSRDWSNKVQCGRPRKFELTG
jgi:hypothetical protein